MPVSQAFFLRQIRMMGQPGDQNRSFPFDGALTLQISLTLEA
jgi:hypothetical protein